MNSRALPVGETIDRGWNTFREYVGLAVGVMLAVYLIPSVLQWLSEHAGRGDSGPGPLVWVAITIVEVTLELGASNVFLRLRDRRTAEFADVFNIFPLVPVFFVASLIAFAAFAVGLVLLIVPGIVVAVRLQFIPYVVLDEGLGPLDSLRRSWDLTRGFTLDLFLFDLLLGAINLLGAIALGIGVFVSAPVTRIAHADMYRFLRGTEVPPPASASPAV